MNIAVCICIWDIAGLSFPQLSQINKREEEKSRINLLGTNSSWHGWEAAWKGIPIKAHKILRQILKLNKALSPSHLIASQKSEKERVYWWAWGKWGWMETDFPQSGPLPAWVVLSNSDTDSGLGLQCCCLQDLLGVGGERREVKSESRRY